MEASTLLRMQTAYPQKTRQKRKVNASAESSLIEEGAFYVWTIGEFYEILGDHAELAASYWNVNTMGNVEQRYDLQDELVLKVRL
jgi:uncharacterized protein YyaL (SSP411 family)